MIRINAIQAIQMLSDPFHANQAVDRLATIYGTDLKESI